MALSPWRMNGRSPKLLLLMVSLGALEPGYCQTQTLILPSYRTSVPSGWNISVSANWVSTIFNYDPDKIEPQGLFPTEGAEISILPFAAVEGTTKARTIDDWIAQFSARKRSRISVRRLGDTDGPAGPHNLVEVDADFQRDPQDFEPQHEVSYYFSLEGKLFRVALTYWKDNRHAVELQSICDALVKSIR